MTTMMFKAPPIAIDYQALERCFPSWERFCQQWQQLDRVEMTGEQCQALLEKVMDSSYFSSEMLMNPSIAEFAAVIRNPELVNMDTHIVFRHSLLNSDDLILPEDLSPYCTVIPAVDAYIYINNNGTVCNLILTLARCVLERDGKRVNTSTQFVSWQNDDPFTRRLLSDEGMHFMEFSREAKAIFMAVQMLSLERPEVMVRETVREERQETVKQKGRYKKVRKTHMVRVIRLTEMAVESLGPRGHHVITCPNWGVAGHWRHYKSGKTVWVKPYRKGRERRNSEAYQPKEYALPKEI